MHTTAAPSASSRLRLAELSSGIGAAVLGAGIGVLAAEQVSGFGWSIVGTGLLLHAWGMADKHQLEARRGEARPPWSVALYWVCWLVLAALLVAIAWRVMS